MPNAEIVRTQMNVMPPFPYIHVETTPKREWDPSGENFLKKNKNKKKSKKHQARHQNGHGGGGGRDELKVGKPSSLKL